MTKITKVERKKESEEKPEKWIGQPVYKHRFVASLQDATQSNLYYDFIKSNSLAEIKKKSEREIANAFNEDGMDIGVLITDREGWFVSYRYNLPAIAIVEVNDKGKNEIVNDVETRIKSWVKDKS